VLKRGRSAPFVDPSQTALQSRHIWLTSASRSVLSASAERAADSDQDALFFPAIPAVEHILIDPTGHQHVLLRGNGLVLQLAIAGADILRESVRLTIVAGGAGLLERTVSHLIDLRRILLTIHAQSHVPSWTARTLNRRDSLVVFDCLAGGGTEREAGAILHGATAVARDWRHGSLRQRIRRDRLRAENFIFGGYRALLE
jgi:hypothetical protein